MEGIGEGEKEEDVKRKQNGEKNGMENEHENG